MIAIPKWFASPSWVGLVEALLHSLWIGTLLALVLLMALRFLGRSQSRYAVCMITLAAVFVGTLAAWAVVDHRNAGRVMPRGVAETKSISITAGAVAAEPVAVPVPVAAMSSQQPGLVPDGIVEKLSHFQPWLAMLWSLGTLLMLSRCGWQIAGADRLKRACRPVQDAQTLKVMEEVSTTLRVVRRIHLVVCNSLSSPAVVGWLVPTLIVPASLLSSLTQEQIRLILLHEVAHIRRGDYFANILQMFMESLFYFNPAVWWISRQARLEREACCDEIALQAGGSRTEYARMLVSVAELMVAGDPETALGFGRRADSSSISLRVQRLLSPGWNQHLRLSWSSLLGSFASAVLILTTVGVGTRVTVAAVLTPEQRMQRIGQLLVEQGESFRPDLPDTSGQDYVEVSGKVETEDRLPLPHPLHLMITSNSRRHSGSGSLTVNSNGLFSGRIQAGRIVVSGSAPGYAPSVSDVIPEGTNRVIAGITFLLKRGNSVPIRVVDADSRTGVGNAKIHLQCWPPGSPSTSFPVQDLVSDSNGNATFTNASDLPTSVSVDVADFENTNLRFERVPAGKELVLAIRKGGLIAGTVHDKLTGLPISGAEIRMLSDGAAGNASLGWENPAGLLAVTDRNGHFHARKLRVNAAYDIGVTAPQHESHIWTQVVAARTNLFAKLGPELVVRGEIRGDLSFLRPSGGDAYIQWNYSDQIQGTHSSLAPLVVSQGIARFEFTNRLAGLVSIHVGKRKFEREVTARVSDWVIELAPGDATEPPVVPSRRVIARLVNQSGAVPRGNVSITSLDPSLVPSAYAVRQHALVNGEVRFDLPTGSQFEVAPAKTTIGFWFEKHSVQSIPAGTNDLVIELPVVAAGVITATARSASGDPLGDLGFSVHVLKRSPLVKNPIANFDAPDSWSANDGPRKFITPPLPLDGTYQIIAWKGNSFALSQTITLSEKTPDSSVEIRFPESLGITGSVTGPDGQPVAGLQISPSWSVEGRGFGLKDVFTDNQGRFVIEGATRTMGRYLLDVRPQSLFESRRITVDLEQQPLQIRLVAGHSFSGRLVLSGTKLVIPRAPVRLHDSSGKSPSIQGATDGTGRFEFSNLQGDASYFFSVEGANLNIQQPIQFRNPAQRTNQVFDCVLWQGSPLVPIPAP